MKKIINNTITKSLIILISSVVIATVLMIGLYSVPADRAVNNVKNSIDIYSDKIIKTWTGNNRYAKLDTQTDIIMINMAVCRPYDTALENSLLNPHYILNESIEDPHKVALTKAISNEKTEYDNYSRYWHGGAIFMIPGLFFFDLGQLRMIMMFIHFFISLLVLNELQKIDKVYALLFVVVILFLNPVTTVMSYALFQTYMVSMVITYASLKFKDVLIKNDGYVYLFLVGGILTSFFDFLTYPLVTWGIPMVTYTLINNNKDFIKSFLNIVKMTIAWCVGYFGMWAGKWTVATLLTNENVFESALSSLALRSGNNDVKLSYFDTLDRQFETFDQSITALLLVGLIIIVFEFIKNIKSIKISINMFDVFSFVLCALSPFVWYFVIRNHSYYHPWFEYRHLSIFIWSVYALLIKFVSNGTTKSNS